MITVYTHIIFKYIFSFLKIIVSFSINVKKTEREYGMIVFLTRSNTIPPPGKAADQTWRCLLINACCCLFCCFLSTPPYVVTKMIMVQIKKLFIYIENRRIRLLGMAYLRLLGRGRMMSCYPELSDGLSRIKMIHLI